MFTSEGILNKINKIGLSYGYCIEWGAHVQPCRSFLVILNEYFECSYEKSRLLLIGIENKWNLETFLNLSNSNAYHLFKMVPKLEPESLYRLINYNLDTQNLRMVNRALNKGISLEVLEDHDLFNSEVISWQATYFVAECLLNNYHYQMIDYRSPFTAGGAYACLKLLANKDLPIGVLDNCYSANYVFLNKCVENGVPVKDLLKVKELKRLTTNMLKKKEVIEFINRYGHLGNEFFYIWYVSREYSFNWIDFDRLAKKSKDTHYLIYELIESKDFENNFKKLRPYWDEFSDYDYKKILSLNRCFNDISVRLENVFLKWKHTSNPFFKAKSFQFLLDSDLIDKFNLFEEEELYFADGSPIDIFKVIEMINKYHSIYRNREQFMKKCINVIYHSKNYNALKIDSSIIDNYFCWFMDFEDYLKIKDNEYLISAMEHLNDMNLYSPKKIKEYQSKTKDELVRFIMIATEASAFKNIDKWEAYKFLEASIPKYFLSNPYIFKYHFTLDELKSIDFSKHFIIVNKQMSKLCKSDDDDYDIF